MIRPTGWSPRPMKSWTGLTRSGATEMASRPMPIEEEWQDDRPARVPPRQCDHEHHDGDRDEHSDEPQEAGHANL